MALHYNGKPTKSVLVADLIALSKRDGQLRQREVGGWNWAQHVEGFRSDCETFVIELTNGAQCELSARTGEVRSRPAPDAAAAAGYTQACQQRSLPDTVNRLAAGMYAVLAESKEPANIVFSPIVSAAAFIHLSRMTVEDARAEINRALGIRGAAEATPASESIAAGEQVGRSPTLAVVAGLWYRKGLQVRSELAPLAAEGQMEMAEFDSTNVAALPAAISDWLADELKPQKLALDGADIVGSPLFVLVNAAVFRANWKTPFKEVKSGLNFLLPNGTKAERDSVRGDQVIRVLKTPGGVIVGSIPFASERYDMVFVLPPVKTADLKPVRQAVATSAQIERLLAELDLSEPKSHDVELPVLSLSQKMDLQRVGPALGIKALFAPTGRTFTGLFAKEQTDAIQFQAVQAVTFQLDQFGGDGDGGSDQ